MARCNLKNTTSAELSTDCDDTSIALAYKVKCIYLLFTSEAANKPRNIFVSFVQTKRNNEKKRKKTKP